MVHGALPLFIVQAVLIIGLSRAVGLAARRMRQPMVIAEIVAGIMLGPSFLGWLLPGVASAIFPHESLGLLQILSQIGLILFMFLVGLEFDAGLLRGRGHTSVVISHTSIIVPFCLGALIALYLYPRLSAPSVPFGSFTLFMGAAMSITAFPVLARILVERRLLRTKLGAVTITCAAVDDVTAWCILAFVVSIVRVTSPVAALWTTVLSVAYVAAMLVVVRPFVRRLASRSANREGLNQNVVATTLILVLLSSWATEWIGIHALFGAFIFGAVVPKEERFAQILADKLEDLVVVLLLPLFFAYSGLRTEIGLLNTGSAWLMCGLVIAAACLGKFGGSALAARLTGLRWREATALGILMNTRGLIELIVLNIGLDLGVISPALFTMMVLMALLTTFMTTPLLELVYPIEAMARDEEDASRTAASGFTVLMCVAYDRSGPAMVTVGGALAGDPAAGGRLYALRLVPPTDRASFVLRQQAGADDAAALAPLLARAEQLGLAVRPLSFVSPQPAHDICNVAAVKGADLVLLGWHKPIFGNTVLSGTVHDVMQRAETDVGVLIDRGLDRIEHVLLPYLGGAHDAGALRLAHRLAGRGGIRVTVLHVIEPERAAESGTVASNVRETFADLAGGAVSLQVIRHATAWRAVVEEAARGYDLVLIGAGAEWGLEHRPFAIHSEQIIRECPTSLLVVRQARAHAAAEVSPRARAAG